MYNQFDDFRRNKKKNKEDFYSLKVKGSLNTDLEKAASGASSTCGHFV